MIDFRQIVKDRMAALNLSQRRLCAMIREAAAVHGGPTISQQHLSDWLAGRYRLSDDKLAAVLAALEIKDLMFEDQET